MRLVAFMPIRLNSKRVKNKNIRDVLGRPLFCWLAETVDSLGIPFYIFTNYSKELKAMLDFKPHNLKFLSRSPYLDLDTTKGIEIYREFTDRVKADAYLLVHCTSPFVTKKTLNKVIGAVISGKYNSAQTIEKKQTFVWYKGKPLNFEKPRPRTQDLTPVYLETSGAYCYKAGVLNDGCRIDEQSCKFVIVDSIESIDIDTYEDLITANRIKMEQICQK